MSLGTLKSNSESKSKIGVSNSSHNFNTINGENQPKEDLKALYNKYCTLNKYVTKLNNFRNEKQGTIQEQALKRFLDNHGKLIIT